MQISLQNIRKAFSAEWLKTKGLGLLYLGLFCGGIMPLVTFLNHDTRVYAGIPTSSMQYFVLENLSSFGGFFIIVFAIISAIRAVHLDHKNNGWTFMETQPLGKFSIYTGKFLVLATLSFLCILFYFLLSVFFGIVAQLVYPLKTLNLHLDAVWMVHTFLRTFIMVLGVLSLQTALAMLFNSFIMPFLIGFVGLIVNIIVKVNGKTYDFIPYNNVDTSLAFKDPSQLNHFFNYSEYLSVFWMVVFFVFGYLFYSRRGFKNAFFKNSKTVIQTLVGILILGGLYLFLTRPIYPIKLPHTTLIEGSVGGSEAPTVLQLIENDAKDTIATIPVKNGKFYWEWKKELPLANYNLYINNEYYAMIFSKGDHIKLDIYVDTAIFYVSKKGTRTAEDQFVQNSNRNSNFFDLIVREKQMTNDPLSFYENAMKDWKEEGKYLSNYRTKENIHLSQDFFQYARQVAAARMLDAISTYQKMTSFTDEKFAPPAKFDKELRSWLEHPSPFLLSNEAYSEWRLKNLLPPTGTNNPDSAIFSALSNMPKSQQKDQLLKTQLLKMIELTKDENERNQLFASKSAEFLNPKFKTRIENELTIINNQQRGKPFPNIQFEDKNGNKTNLAQFKGKYVVIDFWATWCGPCKATTPAFEHQAQNYNSNKVVFLSASIDRDKSKWNLEMKNNLSEVVQWWVAHPDSLHAIGLNAIPRFMLIDPEGNLYNASLPRPNETNFEDILGKVIPKNPNRISF